MNKVLPCCWLKDWRDHPYKWRLVGIIIAKSESESDIPKPVQANRDMDIKIFSSQTKTVPKFIMPYTNPAEDVDVSSYMHNTGYVELGLSQVIFLSAIRSQEMTLG